MNEDEMQEWAKEHGFGPGWLKAEPSARRWGFLSGFLAWLRTDHENHEQRIKALEDRVNSDI